MKKKVDFRPRLVYSVIGETGENPDTWFVTSFNSEQDAMKACNSLNAILAGCDFLLEKDSFCSPFTDSTIEKLKIFDKAARLEYPGSRYSIIRYTYPQAKDAGRLPAGEK